MFRENTILTFLGALAGLVLGVFLHRFVMSHRKELQADDEAILKSGEVIALNQDAMGQQADLISVFAERGK